MNPPVSLKQVLVLLAEDEPLLQVVAQDALEEGGYAVLTASDGRQALHILDTRAHELSGLVTDIRLGTGPSGWEVAHHARQRKEEIPIVYTTGDSTHEWSVKGVPNSLVLQKPYASAQLVTAVSSLITADTKRTN